ARTVALRAAFVDLQRRLGYRPDVEYPVELFTLDQVRAAIAADEPDEDQREIRQAFGDTKIVLVGSAELDEVMAMTGAAPSSGWSQVRSSSSARSGPGQRCCGASSARTAGFTRRTSCTSETSRSRSPAGTPNWP